MRLVSVDQMKSLENEANSKGYLYSEMMRNAGKEIARIVDQKHSSAERAVLGLIGGGNNGGDTLLTLVSLIRIGWKAHAILFKDRADDLVNEFRLVGGEYHSLSEYGSISETLHPSFILDGVYGTGFRSFLPSSIIENLHRVRHQYPKSLWVAVDCPSGVDCETGEVSERTIPADFTICLEAVKEGLMRFPAFSYCGEIEQVDLGLQKYSISSNYTNIVDKHHVKKLLPQRSADSHKGRFGKVLVIGGSENYTGAPILAGRGAYSVGCGLVQIAVPETVYLVSAGVNPELTWLKLSDYKGSINDSATKEITEVIQSVNSVICGPGIGRSDGTRKFVSRLILDTDWFGKKSKQRKSEISSEKTEDLTDIPFVIDADALVLLASFDSWEEKIKPGNVITPHPGEMSSLSGLSIAEIQEDRQSVAKEYARKWNQVIVLKGALTVIAAPDGRTSIIPFATSALAKAGTGDVLAGMIGGYLGQGVETFDAAITATWIHGAAGMDAIKQIGAAESVLATDIIRSIPHVIRELRSLIEKTPPH